MSASSSGSSNSSSSTGASTGSAASGTAASAVAPYKGGANKATVGWLDLAALSMAVAILM